MLLATFRLRWVHIPGHTSDRLGGSEPMSSPRRPIRRAAIALTAVLVGSAAIAFAGKHKQPALGQMSDQKRALHALNRLTFGPRPGDIDRVAAMGVDKWNDLQLHPDHIDDSNVEA